MRVTTKGRYTCNGGGDVHCLADLLDADDIAVRPQAQINLPRPGMLITCYLDEIGAVDGTAGDLQADGFALCLVAGPERRARFEARLAWLRGAGERDDQRQGARIIPIHRQVRVTLSGGLEVEAVIADLSKTGAALMLQEKPEIGAAVTVGKRFATVVRHSPDGIGVAFRLPFGSMTFNERVVL